MIRLLIGLQNDVEPLPEPWRTIFFNLTILSVLVIPIAVCVYGTIRRRRTKGRLAELGSSWEDVDDRVPKQEETFIEALPGIFICVLIIFAGIVVGLMVIIGPIVRDIAVVLLIGFTILFVIVICPLMLIWAAIMDDRKNAARIKLAEEDRRLRETGDYDMDDSLEKEND